MFLTFSLFCSQKYSFGRRQFLSVWDFFVLHQNFSFVLRLFLSPTDFFLVVKLFLWAWEFFFSSETFYLAVRFFLFQWDFFFYRETFYFFRENVSPENYFWSTIKEGFGRLCSLRLVLQARNFYSPEKEEVKREKKALVGCVACN